MAELIMTEEGSTPATPSSGKWKIYPKSDGLYFLEDTGLEIGPLTAANGWIPMSHTWTRTGNHTFTVSGDVTAIYRRGARVRYKDGGSFEYGVIRSSSHAAGTTTVTLIANTNHSMAAATITDKYISYIPNPEGFPVEFNYTPVCAGNSGGTPTVTINSAKWVPLASGANALFFDITINNVSTATGSLKVSFPWTATSGAGSGRENAVTGNMLQVQVTTNDVVLFTYNNLAVMTNSYRAIVGCVIDFTG